jgi:dolichyl-phosphate-mannose--protein O-mannosyl transferase
MIDSLLSFFMVAGAFYLSIAYVVKGPSTLQISNLFWLEIKRSKEFGSRNWNGFDI